jgi:hypothetical protein
MMIAEQELQRTTAQRLRSHLNQIYELTQHLSEKALESLDYSEADIWTASGFRMASCGICRAITLADLMIRHQGRCSCPERLPGETGYPTVRNRRYRTRVKYRRREEEEA